MLKNLVGRFWFLSNAALDNEKFLEQKISAGQDKYVIFTTNQTLSSVWCDVLVANSNVR